MAILFKNDSAKLADEYFLLPVRMREILLLIERLVNAQQVDMVITCIHRTDTEQKLLCEELGRPYRPTVHEVYRGVDVRSRDLSPEQQKMIAHQVNQTYCYDSGKLRSKYTTVVVESNHFHIQIGDGWDGK